MLLSCQILTLILKHVMRILIVHTSRAKKNVILPPPAPNALVIIEIFIVTNHISLWYSLFPLSLSINQTHPSLSIYLLIYLFLPLSFSLSFKVNANALIFKKLFSTKFVEMYKSYLPLSLTLSLSPNTLSHLPYLEKWWEN